MSRIALSSALVAVLSFACGQSTPAPTAAVTPSPTAAKTDGRFQFGGLPTAASLAQAKSDGVTVVISNLSPEETKSTGFDESAACAADGLQWVNIPTTPDRIDVAAVDAFAKVIEANGEGKVLTHCKSGNRAAGLYAAYLARCQKVPVEEAIVRAKALGLSKEPTIESVRKVAALP